MMPHDHTEQEEDCDGQGVLQEEANLQRQGEQARKRDRRRVPLDHTAEHKGKVAPSVAVVHEAAGEHLKVPHEGLEFLQLFSQGLVSQVLDRS